MFRIRFPDNLWLDTAMIMADYLPCKNIPRLDQLRIDRILYGSDFPNIPYAWNRELKKLAAMKLSENRLKRLLSENAREFFQIEPVQDGFDDI
ncbi:MAG: amidohydrolase family protein [Desulfatirhabdiaceae bacterium]